MTMIKALCELQEVRPKSLIRACCVGYYSTLACCCSIVLCIVYERLEE